MSPSTYNRTEAATPTRVAYGGGGMANSWGNWCGTCHGSFNQMGTVKHPVEKALSTLATNYTNYVSSGVMNPANPKPYSSLVPFAEATETIATLKSHALTNDSFMAGPGSSDTVTCLSCHRAHATGFGEMLRFYYGWEFMTYGNNYPGLDNPAMTSTRKTIQARGRNMEDMKQAYYDRPATFVGDYNRVLCNKCHAQD